MKMFLSSSFADVIDLFNEFIEEDPSGKTVTFIPTASIPEVITHYVDAAKEAFKHLGILVETLDLSTSSTSEIEEKLTKNDYVYVSGGNTFFLLQELTKTGTDKLIIEQINKGKLYIGESAGSIIMSPTIKYVEAMDDKSKATTLTDFSGLNQIQKYPLPHYGSEYFNDATKNIIENYDSKIELLPISNDQAILVSNNHIIVR